MSDDDLKGCRDQAVGHLSLRGLEPGIFNQYRAIPYDLPAWPDDEFLAELILCDALTQEGVAAWPGDATCIVSDIVRSYHRKAESQSAALAAKDAEIARLREALIVARGAIDYDISPKAFDIVDRALTPPGAHER